MSNAITSNATTSNAITSNKTTDDMRPEYDFDYSKSKANRFVAQQSNKVALDAEVAAYLRARAQAKGVDLDTLVNDMLHREIALIEAVK